MSNILEKIRDFNWSHFNDLGKEASKLADAVMGIATDARKLGKDATAEQIASLITRVKSLKDGTSIDELLSQILGGAESIFDEHADERADLLKKGQKQSDDLDAPQDAPKPPPIPTGDFPYGQVFQFRPNILPEGVLLKNGDTIWQQGTASAYVVEKAGSEHKLDDSWRLVLTVSK